MSTSIWSEMAYKKKGREQEYYTQYMRVYRQGGGKQQYQRRNARQTTYRQAMKEKAIAYKGGCCSRCGGVFDAVCMDFHHIDHTQKEQLIAKALLSPWHELQAELDKCVLLCSNCHRIAHKEDGYTCLQRGTREETTERLQLELLGEVSPALP